MKDIENNAAIDDTPLDNTLDTPLYPEVRAPSSDIIPELRPLVPRHNTIDEMHAHLHDTNDGTALSVGIPIVDKITLASAIEN